MQTTLEDRQAISDLMTGWMHRDLAQWEQLAGLFHPDGTIEVTWFEGPAADFIAGSQRMGKSDLRTKHFVGQPVVHFNGAKAIVETNAMIIGENIALELGCVAHSRFYDQVEKRNGEWKIVRRQCIYDNAYFTFPCGIVEIDREAARQLPRGYAALAYLLAQSGFPVRRVFATKGSELEAQMKQQGEAWLAA
ncbi:nuclear transport factor 2 family protein [Burkholderia sp. Ax-1719]|uniref:nuclear transport factor 2 family protein n=1 Tax=Burkholderia sp. Ax-1719 TaxID=2608334 RepID=UPI001424491C|nr:nuclear transport factor 2 family protein [Burkholderia sp. Ax-1719]NIE66398.1 nuclear transport factor 2 family protein [Burkholderia sp. Ax-1719]